MMRRILMGVTAAALAAGVTPACSDDTAETEPPATTATSTATGTGGAGGAQGTGGAGGGQGGAGGAMCDTENDPTNCGACGNLCAPGQTCVAGACTCGVASVSFAQTVQPILTASCAKTNCHSGATPKAGLDLVEGAAYAELVNVEAGQCDDEPRMRVMPGEPSMSYVIDKVMNTDLCAGKKMPPAVGAMLEPAEIQAVSDWICAGALDN